MAKSTISIYNYIYNQPQPISWAVPNTRGYSCTTTAQKIRSGIVRTLDHPDPVPVDLQGQSPPHNAVIVDPGTIQE